MALETLTANETKLIEALRKCRPSNQTYKYLTEKVQEIIELDEEVQDMAIALQKFWSDKLELQTEEYWSKYHDVSSLINVVKKFSISVKAYHSNKNYTEAEKAAQELLFATYMLQDRLKIENNEQKWNYKKSEEEKKIKELEDSLTTDDDFEFYILNANKEKLVIYPYNPEAYNTESFNTLDQIMMYPDETKGVNHKLFLDVGVVKVFYRTKNSVSFIGLFTVTSDDVLMKSYLLVRYNPKTKEKESNIISMTVDLKLELNDPKNVFKSKQFFINKDVIKRLAGQNYEHKIFFFSTQESKKPMGNWRIDWNHVSTENLLKFVPTEATLLDLENIFRVAYPDIFPGIPEATSNNDCCDVSKAVVGKDSFQMLNGEAVFEHLTTIDLAITDTGAIIIPYHKLSPHEKKILMKHFHKSTKMKYVASVYTTNYVRPLFNRFSSGNLVFNVMCIPLTETIVILPWKEEWQIGALKGESLGAKSLFSVNGSDYELQDTVVYRAHSEDFDDDLFIIPLDALHEANLLKQDDFIEDLNNAPETLSFTFRGIHMTSPDFVDVVDDHVIFFTGDDKSIVFNAYKAFKQASDESEKVTFPKPLSANTQTKIEILPAPREPQRKFSFEFIK